jgi:hypothetical protein
MAHEKTRDREVTKMVEAYKERDVEKGLIITEYEKDRLIIEGTEIIVPIPRCPGV